MHAWERLVIKPVRYRGIIMKKPLITTFALSSVVALSTFTMVSQASENPFVVSTLKAGYQLAAAEDTKPAEGKCGEGKCGEKKPEKTEEGKCGEGKCGAGKQG